MKKNKVKLLMLFSLEFLIMLFGIALNFLFKSYSSFLLFKIIKNLILILISYFVSSNIIFKTKIKTKKFIYFVLFSILIILIKSIGLNFLIQLNVSISKTIIYIFIYVIYLISNIYLKLKIFGFQNVIISIINKIKKHFDYINIAWQKIVNKKAFMIFPKNIFMFLIFIISIFTVINFYLENNLLSSNVLKILLIIFISLIYFCVNFLINKYSKKIDESKFFLIMLLYIIPIIFIYPPYTTPDENLHFYQSFAASQTIEINNGNKIELPKNIECLNYSLSKPNNKVTNFNEIKSCILDKGSSKYKITKAPGMERNLKPESVSIGYVFQSLGIKIVDLFTNSPLLIYYIAKFIASMATFVICYFILKKATKYKRIILFLITMPMFIQQMCSFSYDSLLNSLIILLFALYVSFLTKKDDIKLYNFIPLYVIGVYLLCLKIVYFPLLLIACTIPYKNFKTKKNKILNLIILIFVSFTLSFALKKLLPSNPIVSTFTKDQIDFVFSNPTNILKIIKNTFILDGFNYIKGLFGFFSWFKFRFADIIIFINIIFMLALFMSEESIIKNKKTKIFLSLILIISFGLIFCSMYFCWEYNYKLLNIIGVQGRYFIPLLPFLFLLVAPKNKKIFISKETIYSYINIMLCLYLLYSSIYFY